MTRRTEGDRRDASTWARLTNESLRANFTGEMAAEIETVFNSCAEGGVILDRKLPLALKAMGLSVEDVDPPLLRSKVPIDAFFEIVASCMERSSWASQEIAESFALFDSSHVGNVGPTELKSVFARLGEMLLETELRDQLRDFDIDGDLMIAVSEYSKMVSSTRGVDFQFDDVADPLF